MISFDSPLTILLRRSSELLYLEVLFNVEFADSPFHNAVCSVRAGLPSGLRALAGNRSCELVGDCTPFRSKISNVVTVNSPRDVVLKREIILIDYSI